MTENTPRLFNLSQASGRSGVPVAKLRRAAEAGALKAADVGTGTRRHWRVSDGDLAAYLDALKGPQ